MLTETLSYRAMRPRLAQVAGHLRRLNIRAQKPGTLPGAVLIGAMRAGTTTLHHAITGHPGVKAARMKETHFFDENFDRGLQWYRRCFAADTDAVNFEATPSYLFHPLAAERAARMLPDAKFIVVLRDPVARAKSHYQYERARGYEPLSFADAIAAEAERTDADWQALIEGRGPWTEALKRHSYLRRGLYGAQLRRWTQHVSPKRMLILEDRAIQADPAKAVGRVFEFLELAPVDIRFERKNASQQVDADLAGLREYFAEDSAELVRNYGREFSWLQ